MAIGRSVDFVVALEHPEGGLRAWPDGPQYPECTGYSIPTLQAHGEHELANRCAEWVMTVQNDDGSFPGLDGISRTFDTAAIVEGLRAVDVPGAKQSVERAEVWLRTMRGADGVMRVAQDSKENRCYLMRVNGIMGDDTPADYWLEELKHLNNERTHYIAYCLEGLYRVGRKKEVKAWVREAERITRNGIMPYSWDGISTDYCATAQFGLLRAWCGLDYMDNLIALRKRIEPDGAVILSDEARVKPIWAAKFYLDLEAHYMREASKQEVNAVAVVVGINHWDDITKSFVMSLRRYNPQLPVIVVDNASDKPYPDKIHGVQILRLDERAGYGIALNAAIKSDPGREWYICFNNDCVCDGPFVKDLMALDSNTVYGSGWNYDKANRTSLQWSAWLCISAKAVKAVGLFDPKLEAAFEDFDLQLRAKRAGLSLEWFDIPVRHLDRHTRREEKHYESRWERSRDWYLEKHGLLDDARTA